MPIHHNPAHRNPAGILRKLPAVLAAFALIMASTVAVDQEPAEAACVFHDHDTWPNWRYWQVSWAKRIPHHSTCNDMNVVWAGETELVKGQYHHSQHGWTDGMAGEKLVRAGDQPWPWPILVRGLKNGTLYRVATPEVPWRSYTIAV